MLYELLKSSPRLEQVQTVLLDWGVEQLYGLLLNGSFRDEVRERVFRVRGKRSLLIQRCCFFFSFFVP